MKVTLLYNMTPYNWYFVMEGDPLYGQPHGHREDGWVVLGTDDELLMRHMSIILSSIMGKNHFSIGHMKFLFNAIYFNLKKLLKEYEKTNEEFRTAKNESQGQCIQDGDRNED